MLYTDFMSSATWADIYSKYIGEQSTTTSFQKVGVI